MDGARLRPEVQMLRKAPIIQNRPCNSHQNRQQLSIIIKCVNMLLECSIENFLYLKQRVMLSLEAAAIPADEGNPLKVALDEHQWLE